jgi:hypothetical protein
MKTMNARIRFALPLSLLILIALACTYWHKVNLKFLLPENYEGMVIVAWDEENGAEKVSEDDYEVYKIPSTGILKTQVTSRSLDVLDEKYYSYNKLGLRTRLEMIDPSYYKDTIKITKKNQYYVVGGVSSGYKGKNNMIFFITKDRKSKFMNNEYRKKYMDDSLERFYQKIKL